MTHILDISARVRESAIDIAKQSLLIKCKKINILSKEELLNLKNPFLIEVLLKTI